MPNRFETISFLSDYGTADEFVGVVKSVIRSISPDAHVIDVTHEIPPHDVRAGGLALARSAQYLCPGVVLAVVDPGVGTDRKAIAIEVGGGQSILVGPDNGLLAPAVALVGGADRAVEITNPELLLPAPGDTFAGRDVFAPAAAHLCAGVPFDDLGPALDTATLMPATIPVTRMEDGALQAEVLWVDRFGNLQLNVDPEEVDAWGSPLEVRLGQERRVAHRARTYDDVGTGQLGLVLDSYGLLSLAVARASAAEDLRLGVGDAVALGPASGGDGQTDGPPPGASTPVQLGRSRP